MQSHDISIEFKARYFTSGDLGLSTRSVWFVLHGYGQLASFFIRKFDILKNSGIYTIAPEALSRFYVDPLQSTGRASDRVGATWMTKENRLTDIENYVGYLNDVYKSLDLPPNIPVTLLGFSQGAATVSRWISDGRVSFDRLILWSGVFPPDMNFSSAKEVLKEKEIVLVYGTKDPFLTGGHYASTQAVSAKLDINPVIIPFEGGHEIPEEVLKKLI